MHSAPLSWPQRDSAVRGYPARRSSPVWAETGLPVPVELGDAATLGEAGAARSLAQ